MFCCYIFNEIERKKWSISVHCTKLFHSLSFFRFSLIHRTGTPCTAISFCLRRKNEILVALADNSLRCYDIGRYWTAYSTHARKKWRSALSHTCHWTVNQQKAVIQGQWVSWQLANSWLSVLVILDLKVIVDYWPCCQFQCTVYLFVIHVYPYLVLGCHTVPHLQKKNSFQTLYWAYWLIAIITLHVCYCLH